MKIHRLKGQIQNIFIAEYPDKIIILDGACRSDFKLICNYIIKNLNRDISDIKLCVVTHMHPDHAGAANLFRKKFNIPVAAYKTVDLWYSGFGGAIQHFVDISLAWYVVYKSGNGFKSLRYKRKIKPDFLLSDNSEIPMFPDWKAIYTPGHTSHDICLFNESEKTLYAADLLLELNGKFVLPFPVVFPEIMKLSIAKTGNLNFNKLLLAHGNADNSANPKSIFSEAKPELFSYTRKQFNFLKKFIKFTKCAKNFESEYFSKLNSKV